jgi:hypothetical protein
MINNDMLATINEDRDLNDNIIALRELGGPAGLADSLQTNLKTGLMRNEKELQKIREKFGCNEVSSLFIYDLIITSPIAV